MRVAQRRGETRGRTPATIIAALVAVLAMVSLPLIDQGAWSADAASTSPLAVVVVGPAAGSTAQYRRDAGQMAAQLKDYGARVRTVFSPSATWANVEKAARGANLLVYLGAGRGYPGPYGRFDPKTMDGLGLNRSSGGGDRNVRFYGEDYVRRNLDLAPGAIVILKQVPYAAGSSEPGRAAPTGPTAIQRADSYAAGFLGAGAAAVFASDHSVQTIVRDLFISRLSMRSIFWNSPWTSSRYDAVFTSRRTTGAIGILAPYTPGRYYQSVVGRLASTAATWRATWNGSPATSGAATRVSSIPALLTALADNSVTDIVVANGTYRVSPASSQASNSLWIGSRFTSRTRAVTVRAETSGGVTFDGGGTSSFGGITFAEGAHDQTWDGFVFANGTPRQTGAILFGGYAGQAAPHHITLRNITIAGSVSSTSDGRTDHGVYFSQAVGGPHDILIDGLTVDGSGGLDSALHFFHSDEANANAWNVTVRRLVVSGTEQAVILWDPTLRDIVIDGATISGALDVAVRYESPGASGIVLANITSTGSGSGDGFRSSLGDAPPGVTFTNNSFR